MKTIGIFVAGVAAGWVLRASFGSMRGMAVSAVTTSYELAHRMRRFLAEEREFFEDLVAEGKARFEASRAQENAPPAPRAVPKVA